MEARRCISLDRSLQLALARLGSSDHATTSLPQIQELLIDRLSALLGNLIPDRWCDSPSLGSQRRAQVVREAENYMFAYLNRPMTLLEICEAIYRAGTLVRSARLTEHRIRECCGTRTRSAFDASLFLEVTCETCTWELSEMKRQPCGSWRNAVQKLGDGRRSGTTAVVVFCFLIGLKTVGTRGHLCRLLITPRHTG